MIINFRSIPTNSKRKFYRCGFLASLDEQDYRWSKYKEIGKIICLSNDLNTNQANQWDNMISFIPFSGPNIFDNLVSAKDYFDAYCRMLHDNGKQTAEFFEHVSSNEDNVLFGCTFGKDRTGILSAIILRLAGIQDEIIIEDYKKSIDYLLDHPSILSEHWKKRQISCEQYMRRFHIDPQVILSTLKYIDDNYGSVEKYLVHYGYIKFQQNIFCK